MVSVEKWKNHFKRLAHKAFPNEDMYIISQSGRGLGRNSYKKTLYQIRTPAGGTGGKPTIEIVSPVASQLGRARSLAKTEKTIKRKGRKKSVSTSRKGGRKKRSVKRKKPTQKKKKIKNNRVKTRRKNKAVTAVVEAALAAGARKAKKKTVRKGKKKKN